jgi:hypothetical protein
MTFYATDRTPPGPPRLVAFTRREARDGYVQADPDHRASVTVKEAAYLCRVWHGVPLEQALAKGYV